MDTRYLTTIPPQIVAVDDYMAHAKARLSDDVWAYIHSGSANEHTFQQNARAFDAIPLISRVLADLGHGHTRLPLLNETLAHPIILAPVAHQRLAHPDGELAAALAASAQQALFVLSTLSSVSLEDVAKQSGEGPRWFQLYFQPRQADTLDLVRRAESHAYSAIMVTVDAPINGLRNTIQRAEFQVPDYAAAVNLHAYPPAGTATLNEGESVIFQGFMQQAPTWRDIEWLKSQTTLPIIIKGIMHPDDARRAVDTGADGVVLSNHGGRTLDTLPNPIAVLPAARAAVGDHLPILLDSGIRRGADVFKALALGANAVMIGRPILYALATAGALGVAHVIKLLRDELELTMALCGCAQLEDINSHRLWQT